MAEIKKKCVEKGCGNIFSINDEQADFFKKKGWDLPKRCKDCRERRKREAVSPFGEVSRMFRDKRYGKGK